MCHLIYRSEQVVLFIVSILCGHQRKTNTHIPSFLVFFGLNLLRFEFLELELSAVSL